MLRGITLPAFALLSVLFCTSTQAQGPGVSADQDPIAFFASLAELPTEQQDAFLNMAGKSMMENDDSITCNIFGGEASCLAMPEASKFAKNCKTFRPDLKVDCAYYSSSEEHLNTHPDDALNKFLGGSYNAMQQHCPQCVTSLQALWCVQALPECGSFQEHVHKAIFPAIIEAKKAEDAGQPQSVAVAEAVPGLVKAMSKTMACKEMCEAAVSTCSCKEAGAKSLTFGEAIENAEKVEAGFAELGLQTLGEDFRDTLFRDIWDQPVCEIFTSKDDADFAGTCDEDVIGDNAKCTTSDFCDGLNDAQQAGTETIIATQLARSVFAFVEGPAGVIEQRTASTEVAKDGTTLDGLKDFKKPGTGVQPTPVPQATPLPAPTPVPTPTPTTAQTNSADVTAVEVATSPPPAKKKGTVFGAVFGTLLMVILIGAVGAFGWKKYQEYKANRYGDYGPMGLDAYGDDGIPLQ